MFDSFEDINYLFFFTPQLFCLLEINEKNGDYTQNLSKVIVFRMTVCFCEGSKLWCNLPLDCVAPNEKKHL